MLSLPHCPSFTSSHHLSPIVTAESETIFRISSRRSPKRKPSRLYSWRAYRSISYRNRIEDDEEDNSHESVSDKFDKAIRLFNRREYYECHDVLESLWYEANDPFRTLFHALLQCSVALYHLFNQNHRGAMMEMGEGVCKLRKMNFGGGPFYRFEQEISAVLNFVYQTQLELAACNEDFCIAMEQTERSYQLLDGFGAGKRLYIIDKGSNDENKEDVNTYIVFDPQKSYGGTGIPDTRVRLPVLKATLNDIRIAFYKSGISNWDPISKQTIGAKQAFYSPTYVTKDLF